MTRWINLPLTEKDYFELKKKKTKREFKTKKKINWEDFFVVEVLRR